VALPTQGHWGIRSGGNDLNGAGYKTTGGASADYSNQDAAELSITDLASDGAGTGLSTATGGVTAAMAGNYIYIESDGGFTPGYYQVTVVTDGNNFTIDRSAGASKSGGKGKIGGARATITDAFAELVQDGDVIYMQSGAYGLAGAINVANAGTNQLPITIEGFQTSYGDDPTGANRPQISSNTYIIFTSLWRMKNMRVTSSNVNYTMYGGSYCEWHNCEILNTAGSGNPVTLTLGSYNKVIDCQIEAARYRALVGGAAGHIIRTFIRNSPLGLYTAAAAMFIDQCIIHNCVTGIDLYTSYGSTIQHCTIDECTDGIAFTTGYAHMILNNQFTNNVDGIHGTSERLSNYCDSNNWFNNSGNDVTGVVKGPNATANDPGYADQANDNFSEVDDANAANMRLGVG